MAKKKHTIVHRTNTEIYPNKVDSKKMNPLGIQLKILNHLKMRKELNWSQTAPLKHSVLQNSETLKRFSKKENKTPILCNQPNCFFKSPNIQTPTKRSGNESFKKETDN